jgi:hypothetical protein
MTEWKGCGEKESWYNLRYYADICLEELRKNMKILNRDSRYTSQDSKWTPSKHKSETLTLHTTCQFLSVKPQFEVGLTVRTLLAAQKVLMENMFGFITDISTSAIKIKKKSSCYDWKHKNWVVKVHTLSMSTLHRSRQQQSASLSNCSIPRASLGTRGTGGCSGLTDNTHIVVVIIIMQSVLRHVHNLCPSEFFRQCDLVLPLSISNIVSFL